nr:hypothetical protein [Escherichia coli]
MISDEINMKLTSFFNPKNKKTNDMNHKNIEQDILTCLRCLSDKEIGFSFSSYLDKHSAANTPNVVIINEKIEKPNCVLSFKNNGPIHIPQVDTNNVTKDIKINFG